MATYEVKMPKSYSIYPSQIEWLEKQADIETKKTGRKVSASEVLTNIITVAQDEEEHIDKIRLKVESKIKQVAK